MKEFTVCEVVNIEDKTPMTLNTEWLEDDVKIVILRMGKVPLTGQTTITNLCASAPGKPREEILRMYRNELSGKEKDVQFSLNDSRLLWKKKIWKRGTIAVQPLDSIVFLSDLSLQWLKQCGSLQETARRLGEDNEVLEKRYQQLLSQMQEMERVKIGMEDSLYKRFLLLLNSKKKRIRELEEVVKSQSVTSKKTAYDASTDDSDGEVEEAYKKKRKKAEPERVDSRPVASTSKSSSLSPLKPSQESDDDIVLRYEETQQATSNLNVDEDTEDDIFSSQ